MADTYLPRRVHRFRSQALSRLGREELWPYLFVTPDTVGEYGDDDTLSMDWIEPGKTFRHVVRSGNLAKIEEIVSIETLEPNAFLKLAFNVPDAAENAPVSSGFYEVSLSNSTQGTLVQSVREFDRVTLRTRLFVWVDDAFGRQEDISILRAEKAVRKRQASA